MIKIAETDEQRKFNKFDYLYENTFKPLESDVSMYAMSFLFGVLGSHFEKHQEISKDDLEYWFERALEKGRKTYENR